VSGRAVELAKTLAEHDDIDAVWRFGSARGAANIKHWKPEAGVYERRATDRPVQRKAAWDVGSCDMQRK
jgi:hypothetical protein